MQIKSIGKNAPINFNLRLFHRIFAIIRAAKIAITERAKIYHLHDPELIPLGLLFKLFTHAKIIYDCREDYVSYLNIRPGISGIIKLLIINIIKLFEKSAAKHFDAIITADPATENLFIKNKAQHVIIIYNFPVVNNFSIDIVKLNCDQSYDLVYFGTISSYYLTPAFCIASELKKRGRKIRWLFFGYIPELDWAISELERRGIRDFFVFEGRIPHSDVAYKLASCKIGIVPWPNLPKLQNNISQKLFEFFAMGMPVIVSDLPGMRPFVKGKPYAISVSPDDYGAFADAIIYLLDNPVHCERMGIAARQMIKNEYNWDNEFSKLKQLYLFLLNK